MLDDLNAIEKQVFRAYWNDGLLDLFGAAGVLAIGIFWTFDFTVGGAITPALLIPLWAPCRERFIEPRLGMVEFSDARERRNSNRLKMIVALGAVTFFLGVMLYVLRYRFGFSPSVTFIAGLPALLLGFLAVLVALLISAMRFLAYAAVLAVAGIAGSLAGLEPGPIMTVAGVVLLFLALVVILRFFRENPVSSDEQ